MYTVCRYNTSPLSPNKSAATLKKQTAADIFITCRIIALYDNNGIKNVNGGVDFMQQAVYDCPVFENIKYY